MPKVYVAGKVGKGDWRHAVVLALRGHLNRDGRLQHIGPDLPEPLSMFGASYVGPSFAGCDHGCAHGPGQHGSAIDNDGCIAMASHEAGSTRWETAARSLAGIKAADHVFAWLDDITAYGTIVEIGVAAGLGKPVHIYSLHPFHESGSPLRELWFGPALINLTNATSAHTETMEESGRVAVARSPFLALSDFLPRIKCHLGPDEKATLAELHTTWAGGKRGDYIESRLSR